MIKALKVVLKRERGFTLVEMVTVVAIMGVMAAVAVPMVNSQLGKARDKSYLQDKAMIQTAVDSFFTAADNKRSEGQRQFPIIVSTESTVVTTRSTNNHSFGDTTASAKLGFIPPNPLKGTTGGEPKWRDLTPPGNGERDDSAEETLNNVLSTTSNDATSGV